MTGDVMIINKYSPIFASFWVGGEFQRYTGLILITLKFFYLSSLHNKVQRHCLMSQQYFNQKSIIIKRKYPEAPAVVLLMMFILNSKEKKKLQSLKLIEHNKPLNYKIEKSEIIICIRRT